METDRLALLNDAPVNGDGRFVLYWIQRSRRACFNPALEHAICCANEPALPVVTVFDLHADCAEANERHFAFMLEGLAG